MRKGIPSSKVARGHPDFEVLSEIEKAIDQASGGRQKLQAFYPEMLRDEIDKLIDTRNTDRRSYAQLEKVEKTYIGTRVEIRLRKFWEFPKGRLDLRVGHTDVDVKHTMGRGWMIPNEAIGSPCVLSAADEKASLCFMGLVVARREYLTKSVNQDQKAQIAFDAWGNIKWLIFESPYPANFWRTLPLATVDEIFAGKTGNRRVCSLFRHVRDTPVPRKVVFDVAQQLDALKRLRLNGGARDKLRLENILLLSGNFDGALISSLGLPHCQKGEFISHNVANDREWDLVEKHNAKKKQAKR
jgi:hypothetical protein